jgi:hypothetical protein
MTAIHLLSVGYLETDISVTSNKHMHLTCWHAKAVIVKTWWNAQDAAHTIFHCLHRQRTRHHTLEIDVETAARIEQVGI